MSHGLLRILHVMAILLVSLKNSQSQEKTEVLTGADLDKAWKDYLEAHRNI